MDTPSDPGSELHSHFARHQARVRRLVRSLLHDEHATEDIVQDAWVVALRKPPRVGPELGGAEDESRVLGAWFGRVAENLALNSYRGQRRREERERRVVEQRAGEDVGAAVSSDEVVARLELQKRLMGALEELEEPFRSLLRDHFLGEQTLAAIARRDGVAESTLRSRLKSGLAGLRARLDAEEFLGEGESRQHWSLALAPLAFVPRGSVPVQASLSATGSASAAAMFLGGLGSLAGALLMKKAGLLAAVALAMLFVTWQVLRVPEALERVEGSADRVVAEESLADVVEREEPGSEISLISKPDTARVAVLTETKSGAVEPGPMRLAIQGTLDIEGTMEPPAPTEVSIRVHSGFSTDGDVIDQHSVRSDASGAFELDFQRPDRTVTLVMRAKVPDCIQIGGGGEVTIARGLDSAQVRMLYLQRDTVLHGVVFTPDGEPAPGARVHWNDFEAECDAEGSYELKVVARFVYRLEASHPDHGRTAVVAEDLESGSRTRIDFTLTPGFHIRGTVRDEQGLAVEGARVATFHGGNLHSMTDEGGRFLIQGFSRTDRDRVNVNARLDGYLMASEWHAVPAEGDLVTDVVLKRGARVSGQVVDSEGTALPGAEICLGRSRNDFARLITTTDDEGRFQYQAVASGEQLLWVSADGFAYTRHAVTVPGGGERIDDVIIEVGHGRTVRGMVQDADGVPVEGIRVSLRQEGQYMGEQARSGADGAFEITSLPEGELVAGTFGDGWVSAQAPVQFDRLGDVQSDVQSDAQSDGRVTLTIERAGRVHGRVVDGATRVPVAAFRIRMIDPVLAEGEKRLTSYFMDSVREGYAFEDPNGRWNLDVEQMPVGSVIGVEASAPAYAPGVRTHVVVQPEGSPDEVVIELWPAIDVRVVVTSEDGGGPVAGARVMLTQERQLDEMDRSWCGVTDAEGVALVSGAPVGPVWVKVERKLLVEEREGEGGAGGDRAEFLTLGPFELESVSGVESTESVRRIEVAVPSPSR